MYVPYNDDETGHNFSHNDFTEIVEQKGSSL
jgi:hypothetical protein